MTETTWIVLIIAVALVLILFRDKLKSFYLKANGVDAGMETHDRPSVNITKNIQNGKEHEIRTGGQRDINISENLQEGDNHLIDAGCDNK